MGDWHTPVTMVWQESVGVGDEKSEYIDEGDGLMNYRAATRIR